MKINKITLIPLMLLYNICFVFSQNPAGIKGQTLWLKGRNLALAKLDKASKNNYFNYNPILSLLDKDLKVKNILKNKYSLFVVFKSDVEQENPLINLKFNGEKIQFTNRQIVSSKNIAFKKVEAKNGIILSYFASNEVKEKNKANILFFENLSNPNSTKGNRNDLMELIYYPRLLNIVEQKKVESYLSVKFGISLLGEVDYINSEAKKIWNFKENEAYNNSVTGIGKDDFFNLFQKQSTNAKKEGLCIGLKNIETNNESNKSSLPDKTFLLWGHDKGSTMIKKDTSDWNGIKKMDRTWKMQYTTSNTQETHLTQIIVNKKEMLLSANKTEKTKMAESVWLLVSNSSDSGIDFQKATYYKQDVEDEEKIIFNNVIWDVDKSGSDLFTFIKAPDFFVNFQSIAPNCSLSENGKINLKIVGCQAPYIIKVQSKSKIYNQEFTIRDSFFEIPNLLDDEYIFTVTDNLKQELITTQNLESFKTMTASLASEWQLNENKELLILPQISGDNQELKYEWKQNNQLIATDKQWIASQIGDYNLILTNSLGCEKEFPFKVTAPSKDTNSNWSIYPNPTRAFTPFTLKIASKTASDVAIAIYDISGKVIQSKILGMIKEYEYKMDLNTVGTYTVVLTTNGISETTKLIIIP